MKATLLNVAQVYLKKRVGRRLEFCHRAVRIGRRAARTSEGSVAEGGPTLFRKMRGIYGRLSRLKKAMALLQASESRRRNNP